MPLRNTKHHLVAILNLRILLAREEDIHREFAGIRTYEDCGTAYLCNTHILLIATLDDACYGTLGTIALAHSLTLEYNLHTVALQGIIHIALMHVDIALKRLYLNIGSSRANHINHTLVVRQLRCRQLILIAAMAIHNTLHNQRFHHITHNVASLLRISTRS